MRWPRRRHRDPRAFVSPRCRPAGVLLAYRDGELVGAPLAEVADHVRACPACRDRLADMARVARILREGASLHDDPARQGRVKAAVGEADALAT